MKHNRVARVLTLLISLTISILTTAFLILMFGFPDRVNASESHGELLQAQASGLDFEDDFLNITGLDGSIHDHATEASLDGTEMYYYQTYVLDGDPAGRLDFGFKNSSGDWVPVWMEVLAYETCDQGDSINEVTAGFYEEDESVIAEYPTTINGLPLAYNAYYFDGACYDAWNDNNEGNITFRFYPLSDPPPSAVLPLLEDEATANLEGECPICDGVSAVGQAGGPIQTRNGNLSYQEIDLAIPVAGGNLSFRRSYASIMRDVYTTTVGYGWTHNFDMRLHFTGNTLTDSIELQAAGGSHFAFIDNGDGTYSPYNGVTAELVEIGSSYIVTGFNQMRYEFDSNGNLLEQQDPYGNSITFTHNVSNQLTLAQQGSRYLSYSYDSNGRLSSVTDNLTRSVQLGYDSNGDLTTITDTLGLVTSYEYSGTTHLLTKVTDPSGVVVEETAYDSEGRAVQQWDGEGNLLVAIDFSIDNTTVLTENGVIMTHTYNARNVLVATEYACVDGTTGCQAGGNVAYDSNFKQTEIEDVNGNSTSLSWNSGGSNLEYVQDALGHETYLAYDAYNNLTQTTDARNNSIDYFYDNSAFPTFLTRMQDDLGNTTYYTPTTTSDGVPGLLKQQQDPNGNLTSYQYNSFGQVTQMVIGVGTANAITTTYGYDGVGRLETSEQTAGAESITNRNVYDAGDRLIATIEDWDGILTWQNCSFAAGARESNLCTLYDYDDAGRVRSVTNALGQESLTFYDDAGRIFLSVANYTGGGNPFSYSDPIATICNFTTPDPEENLCSVSSYDSNGRLSTTTDPLGRENRIEYDALGRVERNVTNWVNGLFDAAFPDEDIETSYGYDANGNVTVMTDTLGYATRTFYDALNRASGTIVNWDGSLNLSGCISQPTLRDNNICTQYQYDEVGNTIIVTDTLGRMTRTFYDDLNRVEATVQNWNPATLTSPAQCVLSATNDQTENVCTLMGYDAAGNQITVTNALDQTTLTVYDSSNRPFLSVQNWDGTTTIDEESDCSFPPAEPDVNVCSVTYYDALGRQSGSKDALGNETTLGYDSVGRLETTTRYLNGGTTAVTTTTVYDALGNRVSQTDAEGNVISFGYDDLNRVETTTTAEGVITTQVYNPLGWTRQTIDGLSHITTIDYDDLGRVESVTDAENNVTTYEYDGLGNQTAMIDAESVRTTYIYDDLNRLEQVIENDVSGNNPTHESDVPTTYTYDALGNQVRIINARGYTDTYTLYDDLNRPHLVADALGKQSETLYNALGYRTVITDANGDVATYTYDGLNRLTQVNYLADGETIDYVYDAVGNRRVMTDSVGVTSYDYDDLYRLTEVNDPFGEVVSYGYDKVGNRTTVTYPDSSVATYLYDDDNRLERVTDWDSGATVYGYDAAGRQITTTLPSGLTSVNSYDDANRLIGLTHTAANSELIASYIYTLDNVGNRVGTVELLRTSNISPTGQSWSQTQIITADDATGDDQFGWDVVLDNERLIVGARLEDTVANNAGAIYVFDMDGNQQDKLTVSTADAGDQLGRSVAADGDTMIAGAIGDDDNGTNAGAAYIFTSENGSWTQQAKLTASDGATNDFFGGAVAIEGDTAVVAAYLDDDDGDTSGSVYIFTRTGITWTQQAKLTASDAGAGDYFGWVVAIEGNTIAIGARRDDDGGGNAGAVYIFTGSGSSWTEQAKLTASDAAAGDQFGFSLALENGTLLVGAQEADPNSITNAGAAYVFTGSGSSWTQQAKLTASDGTGGNRLGSDVALSGSRALIGARYGERVNPADNEGAAYIFTHNGSSWQETAKLLASNGATNDLFGASVALEDDVGLAGAYLNDAEATSAGAAYLYVSNVQLTEIAYQYDPLYRLTAVTYTGSISATYDYLYDAVGNMTAYTETIGTESTHIEREFNGANQLISSEDPTDIFSTIEYSYDANGNLLEIQEQILPIPDVAYEYDQRNRLIVVKDAIGEDSQGTVYKPVADYVYDGDGYRVQQVVYSGTTPITTTYTNDNAGLSQVLQSDDGTTQTQMLFGLDLIHQDDGTTTRTLLADGLGSVRTELVGTAIETVTTYEPYGKLLAQTGSSGTVYGYTGEQLDAATSLTYLRARYYNPDLKIFMSRDPFPGILTSPASQHGYSYTHNNPVNLTDPTGETPIAIAVGFGVIIIGGYAISQGYIDLPNLNIPYSFEDLREYLQPIYIGDDLARAYDACRTIVADVLNSQGNQATASDSKKRGQTSTDPQYPPPNFDNKVILYHYTTFERLDQILEQGFMKSTKYDYWPDENIDWRGVNFTDISPAEVNRVPEDPVNRVGGRYDLAHFLFLSDDIRAYARTEYWIGVEFSFFEIKPVLDDGMYDRAQINRFNNRFYYIYPGIDGLYLKDRIVTCGATDDPFPFTTCPPW